MEQVSLRVVLPERLFAFIDNAGEVEEDTTDHDTETLDEGSGSKIYELKLLDRGPA